MHRRHRRALKRRQENAPQRIAERRAEAALQRFGHHGSDALRIIAGSDVQLVRLDQLLPVLLNGHDHTSSATVKWANRRRSPLPEKARTQSREKSSDAAALARP